MVSARTPQRDTLNTHPTNKLVQFAVHSWPRRAFFSTKCRAAEVIRTDPQLTEESRTRPLATRSREPSRCFHCDVGWRRQTAKTHRRSDSDGFGSEGLVARSPNHDPRREPGPQRVPVECHHTSVASDMHESRAVEIGGTPPRLHSCSAWERTRNSVWVVTLQGWEAQCLSSQGVTAQCPRHEHATSEKTGAPTPHFVQPHRTPQLFPSFLCFLLCSVRRQHITARARTETRVTTPEWRRCF